MFLFLQFLASICNQLFNYYRSKEDQLSSFALNFLPPLIGIYLSNNCKTLNDKGKYNCLDTLLLGIYNLEVINEEGQSNSRTFRIPSVSKPSIYHEPSTLSSSSQIQSTLAENAQLKLELGTSDVTVSSFGPYSEYDRITAANRMEILSILLIAFYDHLSLLSKHADSALIRMTLKYAMSCQFLMLIHKIFPVFLFSKKEYSATTAVNLIWSPNQI